MSAEAVVARVLDLTREAGTPAAAEAQGFLSEHLTRLGYDVRERRFRFPVAILSAFPLAGAGLGWLTLVQIPLLSVGGGPAWVALTAWIVGLVGLGVLVAGVALGWTALGGEMREDANLVATRPGSRPRRWIVAHSDSIGFRQSLQGRWLTYGATAATITAFLALGTLRLDGPVPVDLVGFASALAVATCGLSVRAGRRIPSPGARDGGAGLLAAMVAAEETTDGSLGLLLVGAREFGLVGARIAAKEDATVLAGREVVDLGILDDRGILSVMVHGDAGLDAAARLAGQLAGVGLRLRRANRFTGWFTDGRVLHRVAPVSMTIVRGDRRTAAVVHTPADTPAGLGFTTARTLGQALAPN